MSADRESGKTVVVQRRDLVVSAHGDSPVRVMPAWASPPDTSVLVMLGESSPAAAASLRVIRHRLEQRRAEGMWTFGVTSARDGEGKSTFATQLALVLSESQRARVLLVEANFQRPSLARILGFKVPEGQGFSAQIVRKMRGSMEPWCVTALGPALHVLAESAVEAIFPETLHSTHFQNAIGFLSRGYDFLVIDGPSILGSGDANVVENAIDGMILVCQSSVSRGNDLREAVKQVGARKAVGVVLWDVDANPMFGATPPGPLSAAMAAALRGPWDVDLTGLPGPLGKLAEKELHLWVGAWLKDRARKRLERRAKRGVNDDATGPRHLLFALCDHYEPLHGDVNLDRGIARVHAWRTRYPRLAETFRDANGRPPRHSYFFPGEQYDPRFLEPLAEMCEQGLGEVEVHLHHDGDTRETLRASLEKTLADLDRHGVVPKRDGKPAWAFIHGNWCLANARRDGRWCGVDDEMDLLWELGCYADLTFPSAPDQSQPGIVNSIYYPRGDVRRRRAYEDGEPVRVGTPRQDRLLLIEGPIALALRPGRAALRIESGSLDHGDPPTAARLETWVEQDVTVRGRPEWVFVKVHTHGAPERNAEALLGDATHRFHEALGRGYNDGARWKLHYVTAREMFNVARAAMDGKHGDPSAWFDYEVPPPARARP